MLNLEIPGKRKGGRSQRFMDAIEADMQRVGITSQREHPKDEGTDYLQNINN